MRPGIRFEIIRTLLAASVLALGGLAILPGEALALDTTVKYDLTGKYLKSYVSYSKSTNYVSVSARYYDGSRGNGGAEQWRLAYTRDLYWNGSNWVTGWSQEWSGWYYNQFFDGWECRCSTHGYSTTLVDVIFLGNYYSCDGGGSCWYWYSDVLHHYIASS